MKFKNSKKLFSLLLFFFLIPLSVNANFVYDDVSTSIYMFQKRVHFKWPKYWQIKKGRITKQEANIKFFVPYLYNPKINEAANAYFIVYEAQNSTLIENLFDKMNLQKDPKKEVLYDLKFKDNVRTLVWKDYNTETPKLNLSHFGIINGMDFEITIVMDLKANQNEFIQKTLNAFKHVCLSLKIDGKSYIPENAFAKH